VCVPYDRELEDARAKVNAAARAEEAWRRALHARDQSVRALYVAARDEAGPTDLARRIGLTPSTVRGIVSDLARAARARRS
jgi:hypothetical protein